MTEERWKVDAADAGERLDVYLSSRFEVPRNQVQHWIRLDRVSVNGRSARAGQRVHAGHELRCEPLAVTADADMRPEPGELSVLYEDAHLVVVDKPAGLAVHPGAGRSSGTLAHRLLDRYPEIGSVGGPGRPGIVHRLDKDTTGALVVARTPKAHTVLTAAFAERKVQKTYLGLVYGSPEPPEGLIDLPIGRHPRERRRMAIRFGGRASRTRYRTLAADSRLALLELDLETGRTHQIRVHLKALHHPLVGDPIYGEARWAGLEARLRRPLRTFPRPALHAWRIALDHPSEDRRLTVEAPPPEDIVTLWETISGGPLPLD